jgi:hypothetical protein
MCNGRVTSGEHVARWRLYSVRWSALGPYHVLSFKLYELCFFVVLLCVELYLSAL